MAVFKNRTTNYKISWDIAGQSLFLESQTEFVQKDLVRLHFARQQFVRMLDEIIHLKDGGQQFWQFK